MKEYDDSSSETISVSESSEEIHPNIDEKSYKNWKRQMRKEEKAKNKDRLNVLNQKIQLTQEEIEERDYLIDVLKPKYVTKKEDSFRTSEPQLSEEDDYTNILIDLIDDPTLDNLIYVLDKNNINVNRLEDEILYNLSENIKEGNDEVGIILSKLSLFLGYLKNAGRSVLEKLNNELKIPEKMKTFNKDVLVYYEESKTAILNLNSEESKTEILNLNNEE
ncbi:hypothetical protein P3W45_001550 [Vairimorpha bombi]|jgi:hypothetical protein